MPWHPLLRIADRSRWLALSLWFAYIIMPVDGWGLLHGRPLDLTSSIVLLVVWHATSVPLVWLAGIGYAIVTAAPTVGRMVTLSGGNDWLTYEAQARDIGLNGVLMLMGTQFGHGIPYYTQPLYPYALAACLEWFDALRPELGTVGFYVAVWIAAFAGAIALPWLRPKPSVAAAYVPLLIALSHALIGVVFLPDVYVDRMIMPIYVLFAPYCACAVIAIQRAASR